MDEDILKLGKGPLAVEVDLMAPLDENKSPKVHIPRAFIDSELHSKHTCCLVQR